MAQPRCAQPGDGACWQWIAVTIFPHLLLVLSPCRLAPEHHRRGKQQLERHRINGFHLDLAWFCLIVADPLATEKPEIDAHHLSIFISLMHVRRDLA